MTRSIWKGPFIDNYLVKFNKLKKEKKTWSRRSIILPTMVGIKLEIHNGRKFFPVSIKKEMIGHKYGEFSPTKKSSIFKKKKKKR
jgi:small subunit ribosomal protein S19